MAVDTTPVTDATRQAGPREATTAADQHQVDPAVAAADKGAFASGADLEGEGPAT